MVTSFSMQLWFPLTGSTVATASLISATSWPPLRCGNCGRCTRRYSRQARNLLIDQRDLVLARNSLYIAASGILKNPAFLLKRVDTTN